ncbi:MAG: glycosyl transferase group 1 [Chloroflexi bacterium]|nr:glycosyl transferase group 1 [Chloroflexota bacterium]
MKILYIYKDYYPVLGGIENHIRFLAEAMQARGHEVEVLVTSRDRRTRREVINGVPVLKTARWLDLSSAPLSPRLAWEYWRRVLSKNRPAIVHLHAPYPPGELAWLAGSFLPGFGRKGPAAVLTYHSDIIKQKRLLTFYAPFLRAVLRRVNVILPTSPGYIKSSPFLQPLEAKCQPVPLGIELERFAGVPEVVPAKLAEIRAKPGPLLLFTGRLRYYKGLQYLIEAMPAIAPEARLVIVGVGPQEAELKGLTDRLGLAERVVFAGEVSDAELPAYYAATDIFVLPACERSEAFGLVQLEAMAAAKPVVSTELGTGTSYVNQHGETGLVVPPADPAALAGAVNKLLWDAELRQEMGQRGQLRARAEFSLTKMVNRLEEIYIRLSS